MLQSAKPGSQVNPQRPAEHVGVACAGVGHGRPHPPQFARSVSVSDSHPVDTLLSQSRYAPAQLPTWQRPAIASAPPWATAQRLPHAPQFDALACVSTHPPAQHICPSGQRVLAEHPGTHTSPMHTMPAGQWASVVHSTHVCVIVLQTGVALVTPPSLPPPWQPSSLWQPRTHSSERSSQ